MRRNGCEGKPKQTIIRFLTSFGTELRNLKTLLPLRHAQGFGSRARNDVFYVNLLNTFTIDTGKMLTSDPFNHKADRFAMGHMLPSFWFVV